MLGARCSQRLLPGACPPCPPSSRPGFLHSVLESVSHAIPSSSSCVHHRFPSLLLALPGLQPPRATTFLSRLSSLLPRPPRGPCLPAAPRVFTWPRHHRVRRLRDSLGERGLRVGPAGRPTPGLRVTGAPAHTCRDRALRQGVCRARSTPSVPAGVPGIPCMWRSPQPLLPSSHFFPVHLFLYVRILSPCKDTSHSTRALRMTAKAPFPRDRKSVV